MTTTLATLTQALEAVCDEIDGNETELTDDILDRFVDARLAHEAKVASYVHVIDTLKHTSNFYKEKAETYDRRARTYSRLRKNIEDRLLHLVKTHPDLPWKAATGEKIRVQNNPESLKLNFSVTTRSVSNILGTIDGIPAEFIDVMTMHVLNAAAVKAFLKAGNKLSWATLERGKSLRVDA